MRLTQTLWEAIWPPLLFWAVFLLVLLLVLFWNVPGLRAAPQDAVIRLSSAGGSGTVIFVGNGKSLILSCGHCFENRDRYKPVVFDAPSPSPTTQLRPGVRVLKVDYQADLSLLEVGAELPYVCPVAPPGHRLGRLLSTGYDKMCWPAVQRAATYVAAGPGLTYTREIPVPGRSGGALMDLDAGFLCGVCQGYEATRGGRGMYVSHAAICAFLDWPMPNTAAPGNPFVAEIQDPFRRPLPQPRFYQPQPCPGGT